MELKKILHAGCGDGKLPKDWQAYREIRLDNDPTLSPDIVASIVAMPMIEDESFDAVLASHVVEHLHAHEAAMALAEFHRVLKPDGILELWVPDLQTIGGRIALDQLDVPVYQCSMGPITPLDMLYGHRGDIAKGRQGMGHKTGFTTSVLKAALHRAGFEKVLIDREGFELKAKALKGVPHAVEEPGPEGVPLHALRSGLGEETPLQHERPAAGPCRQEA